jgi:hypothetical protein
VEGTGTDFKVIGLQDDTPLIGPIALQAENDFLE